MLGDGFKVTAGADDAVVPFSRAFFESLLPGNTLSTTVAVAKECLKTGESLMEEEKWDQAIEFASNRKVTPERIQAESKSETFNRGVLRNDGWAPAYFKEEYLGGERERVVVGRGLRWPGWYIIAYLGARHVYFESRNDTVGEASIAEGILISVLGELLDIAEPVRIAGCVILLLLIIIYA